MKAIRPLLVIHFEDLVGEGTPEDPMRRPLNVCLPDGTLLYKHDAVTGETESSYEAFQRLTACEAVEP
jgi:hypothetical protein